MEPGQSMIVLRDSWSGEVIQDSAAQHDFSPGDTIDLHVSCRGDTIRVEIRSATGEADIADWSVTDSRSATGRIAFSNQGCEMVALDFVYVGLPDYHPFPEGRVPTPTPTPSALPGSNLAVGKPVTESSSFDSNYTGAKAVDGRLDTKWCTAPDVGELHELTIDLEENCLLTGFKAKHASMGGEPTFVNTYAWRVEVRAEGASYWETVGIVTNHNSDPMNAIGFDPPMWARHVRYVVTDANQTSYDHYARQPEVEVWGYHPGEVPTGMPSLVVR